MKRINKSTPAPDLIFPQVLKANIQCTAGHDGGWVYVIVIMRAKQNFRSDFEYKTYGRALNAARTMGFDVQEV